ncbi:hypothetical protein BJ166DRAFT_594152 [Pestalotiopsis sp. NC0098]|nr:hypothetical protein BJ166DRAFT_594152 [Pestalotiopsis sp. NC0098]
MGFAAYAPRAITKAPVSTLAEIFADAIKEAKDNAVVNGQSEDHVEINRTIFGVDIENPFGSEDAVCTCAESIVDCQATSHGDYEKRDHVGGTTQPASLENTTEKVSLHGQGRSDDPHQPQRNKFGDIPNRNNQLKAARRRANREIRDRSPERYAQIMAEKKTDRDQKFRQKRQN